MISRDYRVSHQGYEVIKVPRLGARSIRSSSSVRDYGICLDREQRYKIADGIEEKYEKNTLAI